jgi:ribonuclease P protein component
VYKSSRRQHARQIAYFWSPRTNTPHTAGAAGPRIGLTVPKAMAPKAVDRNRIKRRMREAIRSALPLLSSNVDLVLHPRRTILTLDFDTLQREVAQIFRSVESASARTSASKLRPATNPIP